MKQPKFKFGDKVKVVDTDITGTITYMRVKNGEIQYAGGSDDDMIWTDEEELELYQEPKARKLYAYKVFFEGFENGRRFNGSEIRFLRDIDIEVNFGSKSSNDFERAPEYDIAYPLQTIEASSELIT